MGLLYSKLPQRSHKRIKKRINSKYVHRAEKFKKNHPKSVFQTKMPMGVGDFDYQVVVCLVSKIFSSVDYFMKREFCL